MVLITIQISENILRGLSVIYTHSKAVDKYCKTKDSRYADMADKFIGKIKELENKYSLAKRNGYTVIQVKINKFPSVTTGEFTVLCAIGYKELEAVKISLEDYLLFIPYPFEHRYFTCFADLILETFFIFEISAIFLQNLSFISFAKNTFKPLYFNALI